MKKIIAFILIFLLIMLSVSSCAGTGVAVETKADETNGETTGETDEKTTVPVDSIIDEDEYSKLDYMEEDLSEFVELGEYLGITVNCPRTYVTETDVENELWEFTSSFIKYEPYEMVVKDRATVAGDFINIDYVGYMDGEEFEGGSKTGDSIVLAENNGFIDWFEDDLYGVMPGTTVESVGRFPSDYYEDLADKEVTFVITVNYIAGHYTIPTVDDEFVAANTEYKTLSEFKSAIRDMLQVEYDNEREDSKFQLMWSKIVNSSRIKELPAKQIGYYYTSERSVYEEYAMANGMTYEEILEAVGMTDEGIMQYVMEMVLDECVLYSIVKAEQIEVTQEDYEAGLETYSKSQGVSKEKLVETYGEEFIKENVLWDKAMRFLLDNTLFTE